MGKVISILGMVGFALLAAFVPEAFAQEGGEEAIAKAGLAIGAGLGIGIAAGLGGLGQGRATAAALNGIGRNPGAAPKMLVPMILGLALIETLVIYTLIIAILLQGKI